MRCGFGLCCLPSQPVTAACVGFKPSVTLSLTRDGEEYFESFTADVKDCVYDRERCCVRLADQCWIEGDLHRYTIHFDNGKVCAHVELTSNAAAGPFLIWLVKQAKLDPSYIRMTGTVTLERFEGDTVAETVTSHAIWEQMYFGLDQDV